MPNISTRALKSACLCAAPSGVCHPHPSVARGTDTVLLYLLHRPALLLQVIEVHRSFSGVELFTAQSTIEPIKLLGTAIVLYQDSVACVTFQFPRVVRSVSSGSPYPIGNGAESIPYWYVCNINNRTANSCTVRLSFVITVSRCKSNG